MTGYARDREAILRRLRRIEGQVRGLTRMVESGSYCIDVLTQISAANGALRSVALVLLDDHLNPCVARAAAGTGAEGRHTIEEASAAIARLVRS
jgi:DNA-binding FrmR family transcriptional regulator